jgi:hypothetical protein
MLKGYPSLLFAYSEKILSLKVILPPFIHDSVKTSQQESVFRLRHLSNGALVDILNKFRVIGEKIYILRDFVTRFDLQRE